MSSLWATQGVDPNNTVKSLNTELTLESQHRDGRLGFAISAKAEDQIIQRT